MSQLAIDIEGLNNVVGHGKFPNRDQNIETGRSLLQTAVSTYQKELDSIEEVAPDNTWIVYFKGRKRPQIRWNHTQNCGDVVVRSRVASFDELTAWEGRRSRRERKQLLSTLINDLYEILSRGL